MLDRMLGQVIFRLIFHSSVKTTLSIRKVGHPHLLGEKTDAVSVSAISSREYRAGVSGSKANPQWSVAQKLVTQSNRFVKTHSLDTNLGKFYWM